MADLVPDHRVSYRFIGIAFVGCLALWLAWGVGFTAADYFGWGEGFAAFGQFGDSFGAINALFTALAFAAVWWTGAMQREELQLQRRELELQTRELSDTRAVFKRQIFETTFFNQLQLVREIQSQLEFTSPRSSTEFSGAAAWNLFGKWGNAYFNEPKDVPSEFIEFISHVYNSEMFRVAEPHLGAYFRTVYRLYRAIDSEDSMSEEEKFEYAGLARAQIGSDQLVVLALNALSGRGEKFIPLIEKYGLLKHLPRKNRLIPKVKGYLAAQAFMGADERTALAQSQGAACSRSSISS